MLFRTKRRHFLLFCKWKQVRTGLNLVGGLYLLWCNKCDNCVCFFLKKNNKLKKEIESCNEKEMLFSYFNLSLYSTTLTTRLSHWRKLLPEKRALWPPRALENKTQLVKIESNIILNNLIWHISFLFNWKRGIDLCGGLWLNTMQTSYNCLHCRPLLHLFLL